MPGLMIPYGRKLPATVNTWLHNSDTDTSGGAAAIAASLAAGQLGVTVPSANVLSCVRPVTYLGFVYGDEQSTLADADGSITVGTKRAFEIPLEDTQEGNLARHWMTSPLKLAAQEQVSVTGRSTGAGAEQHMAIHYVDDPGLGDPWVLRSPGGGDISVMAAQVTAALVANTQSGFTDICGRTTAFVGGQRAISNSSAIGVNLTAVTPFHSAGYSGIVLRHPNGNRQIALGGNAGAATGGVTAPNTANRYDLVEIFGGGLFCTADKPIQVGAFGVGATAQWALLEMELYGVGVDG